MTHEYQTNFEAGSSDGGRATASLALSKDYITTMLGTVGGTDAESGGSDSSTRSRLEVNTPSSQGERVYPSETPSGTPSENPSGTPSGTPREIAPPGDEPVLCPEKPNDPLENIKPVFPEKQNETGPRGRLLNERLSSESHSNDRDLNTRDKDHEDTNEKNLNEKNPIGKNPNGNDPNEKFPDAKLPDEKLPDEKFSSEKDSHGKDPNENTPQEKFSNNGYPGENYQNQIHGSDGKTYEKDPNARESGSLNFETKEFWSGIAGSGPGSKPDNGGKSDNGGKPDNGSKSDNGGKPDNGSKSDNGGKRGGGGKGGTVSGASPDEIQQQGREKFQQYMRPNSY
jgi:hypothetical protein